MLKNKKVATLTLGCKVNQYETDGMVELLEKEGAIIVPFEEYADVYLINTCSVTNMADKKSRQMIHRAKRNNPNAVVVACGCYVQAKADELKADNTIDILISNNKKKDVALIISEYLRKTECNSFADISKEYDSFVDISREYEYERINITKTNNHTRAYVKIQDGCNQFCSYCIIPYVRGRIRSRSEQDIISEINDLAANGVKEVVLTGIHISSYGKDKENGVYLKELIESISKIESIERIRLGSLEPGIITEDFVDSISANKKVCPHFHLSLQSGCDTVLKRMNRRYTSGEYLEKCDMLRKAYDRPALTTDVIVGFPGETDEEFNETLEYLTKLNLYEMHIFKYSPREGTVAAKMPNQISPDVKNSRSDTLIELSENNKRRYEESFVGEELLVLVEEIIEKDNKLFLKGHTERYIDVLIPAEGYRKPEEYINRIISVVYKG